MQLSASSSPPPSFLSQICANLDSDIVSTQNYVPELEERVPRPVKRFDIVDRRPEVRACPRVNACSLHYIFP